MSRIGKKPVLVPKGVDVTLNGQAVRMKGPKGTLERKIHPAVTLSRLENRIEVQVAGSELNGNLHGLSRTLIDNMVKGVSEGFTKSLTLVGVGYRASVAGQDLQLTLGFSHPVVYRIPQGLEVKVDKQTVVSITGADKELVGQSAAEIRSFRPPEPYHGKGVRYTDEVIVTKVGKAAGKK